MINSDSKTDYLDVIDSLTECGAQGVILGCTEIGFLIQASATEVKLYDTTEIHSINNLKRVIAHQKLIVDCEPKRFASKWSAFWQPLLSMQMQLRFRAVSRIAHLSQDVTGFYCVSGCDCDTSLA